MPGHNNRTDRINQVHHTYSMVSVLRVSVTTRLSTCIFIAVVFMLSNAVKFQFIGSKRLGFGDESVKPNPDGHEYDSQAVDIDPSLRESPPQAAVLDDPLAAVSTRGNSSLPHISGLRVAFVGDSLTRYMYLSLAAYLRRGRWIDGKDEPNILEENQFDNWNSFYNYTNNFFRPYEQCDCFRPPKSASKGVENRYFADPVRDNVLYFFQK
jgi:hypothetical protein